MILSYCEIIPRFISLIVQNYKQLFFLLSLILESDMINISNCEDFYALQKVMKPLSQCLHKHLERRRSEVQMQPMKKRRRNRLFSLVLALSMVITMFIPLTASAESPLGNFSGALPKRAMPSSPTPSTAITLSSPTPTGETFYPGSRPQLLGGRHWRPAF